ncbi:ATP-grasp domain-containing protein [Pseudenhygromyxa sp. WMMC2535]|uniref:ATP-grasp domain-containing protein n=1 Tax=Pseudenhygromyxa sp. WMMC2535 TaxID=2712867 RepID=UPI00159614AA|nr:ATP-grasp domain-containing protein [Pseudenhygromyxa sp. WMMC2535]NVB42209.1 ATP-grasp domain-containing protein [Pseudenhygromyxa sp. WMMC2535]
MGALTLGIAVSSGPASTPRGLSATYADAGPWQPAERRSGEDLQDAAQLLGLEAPILRLPSSAEPSTVAAMMADQFGPRGAAVDRLLILAHGPAGGTGRLHAAARDCGLPVLGPAPQAIAGAYDKLLCRQRLAFHNLPVPRTVVPGGDVQKTRQALQRLGRACVLKPRRGAAGAGLRRFEGHEAVMSALAELGDGEHPRSLEPEILVERAIEGREISVVVFRGAVLGMAEIGRTFTDDPRTGSRIQTMTCPPQLDATRRVGLSNLALRASAALGLDEGPTRVDLVVTPRDNEVILEVEPLPPVHRDSVVARVARAAGMSFLELAASLFSGTLAARELPRSLTQALR